MVYYLIVYTVLLVQFPKKTWTRHCMKARSDKSVSIGQGRIQEFGLGAKYGECGARAYTGIRGLCPQWGPGTKPLVGGSGAKPPP